MQIEALESPEQRWRSDKPYHRTGEIAPAAFFNRLTPGTLSNLQKLLRYFYAASQIVSCYVTLLAVGSSTNLSKPDYNDVDFLVFPTEPVKRSPYATQVRDFLQWDRNFHIPKIRKMGSAPRQIDFHHAKLYEFQLFAIPLVGGMPTIEKNFDITFAQAAGGSYEEIMMFHRANKLAFSDISGSIISVPTSPDL